MPSPEEKQILTALRTKDDKEILKIVKEHPELVNMVISTPNNSFSLFSMLLRAERPIELIKFFVESPDFDFTFKNSTGYTNVDAIFEHGRKDVLALVINNPKILMTKEQLTYTRAKLFLELAEVTVNLSSKSFEKDKAKEENLKQMLPMIREATIMHAIKTDDPSLLNLLETAGDNLRTDLSNDVAPFQALEKNNHNLYNWFEKYFKRHPLSQQPVAKNAHAFFENQQKIDKQLEELTKRHEEQMAELDNERNGRRNKRMEDIFRLLNNSI